PAPPPPAEAVAKSPPQSAPGAKNPGGGGKAASPSQPAAPPPSPGGAGPASPDVVGGDKGAYTLNPNPGGDGTSRKAGRRQAPAPYESPVKVGRLGLGAPGALGGPNVNLTQPMVIAAVGTDKLKQERAADGAARRAEHAGRSKTSFDRLRAAIENYEPTVK